MFIIVEIVRQNPQTLNPAAILLISTACTGLIGEMKSVLYGDTVTLPVTMIMAPYQG